MTAISLRLSLAGLALAVACLVYPAHTLAAGSFLIAPSLYPSHTTITTIAPLSNGQMDCAWSFTCQNGQPALNAPIFHLQTQDGLHRLSGWAQFGDRHGHGRRMLFALLASRYSGDSASGMPWNVQAFSDFRSTLMSLGFSDADRVPRLVPRGEVGNAGLQLARSSSSDVMAMTCWTSAIEVEGMVVYAHGSPSARLLALHDLTRQMRAAVKLIESA